MPFHAHSLSLVSEVTFSLENHPLCGVWPQGDGQPEALQSLDKMSLESFCVEALEVVAPKFLVHAAVLLEVIADNHQTVCHGDDGAFAASTSSQSLELRGESNSSLFSQQPRPTDRPCGATAGCPCGSCR
jgi:hypothetical protein